MAGGFWLLGQAVASADTPAPANTADSSATLTSNSSGGSGSTDSDNSQHVKATNDVDNTATTGTVDTSGGKSVVGVIAGNGNSVDASSGKGAVDAKQNVTTVVWINSQANGGNVSGSNNASAGNGASNSASASGTLNSNTTGGSGKHVGRTDSDNSQHVSARNDVDNTATSGYIDASGGKSIVGVIAGNENTVDASNGHDMEVWTASQDKKYDNEHGKNRHEHEHQNGPVDASQTVNTSVTIGSEANGGNVSDSNNASAGNGGSNSATASGVLNSNTTGGSQNGKDWEHHEGNNSNNSSDNRNRGGSTDSDNHQSSNASNDVDNTATTGDIDASGGKSIVGVIAGNGNTLYCTSATGNVTCSQNITTIINIVSQANGGNVSCSNNASAGNAGSAVCPVTNNNTSTTPAQAAAPAAHKAVAPAAKKASVSASAQPHGTLAFTGAETSLPLTLGLLALGLGGALTLAGRRRETATV